MIDDVLKEKFEINIFKDYKINGETTDENKSYSVVETNQLETLSLGGITIQPGKKSFSHSHPNNDEIYYIHSGTGTITIGKNTFKIQQGSVILYDGKEEHYITNTGETEMYLTMVFNNKPKNG
jgi:mannose-6-phosphate isomerase-like protein (cupin superfamily)